MRESVSSRAKTVAALILGLLLLGVAYYQPWRPDPFIVKLDSGTSLKLLSTIAILNGDECRMLSFDYQSNLAPGDLRVSDEAGQFLRVVGADPRYRACRFATVSARAPGERTDTFPSPDRVFTFERTAADAWGLQGRAR